VVVGVMPGEIVTSVFEHGRLPRDRGVLSIRRGSQHDAKAFICCVPQMSLRGKLARTISATNLVGRTSRLSPS
jgi:hypothetical protein